MKKWWLSLADRERKIISLGGLAAALLVGYTLLWSPLTTSVTTLRTHSHAQQKLFVWMQHAERRIQQLKNAGFSEQQNSNEAILVLAEKTLTESKLSRYLRHVQQLQANQLLLKFHKAPFDQLMKWLQILTRQNSVAVQKLTVDKAKSSGTVNATIMLQQND